MKKYLIPILVIFIAFFLFYGNSNETSVGQKPEGAVSGSEVSHDHDHGIASGSEGQASDESFAPTNNNLPKVFDKFDPKRFSLAFAGRWRFESTGPDVIQMTGGKIPLQYKNDGDVIMLARKIVAQLGIDPMQVSPQVDRPANSKAGLNLKTYQHHQGMLVYDSEMSMYVDKSKSQVSIIESNFKKIEKLDLTQSLRPEEAGELLVQDGNKLTTSGEAMIYVDENQGVAAYRFEYNKEGNPFEALLSAETGEILFTRPLFVH